MTKTEPKIKVNLSKFFMVEVVDYHEFDFYKQAYSLLGIDTSYEEVGCKRYYYAVFWVGKKTKAIEEFIQQEKEKFERI